LKETCEKYGKIDTLALKTKFEFDSKKFLSRGIAIVQYSEKSEAACALKKLPFERNLGEFLDIDFYQSNESRI